MKPNFLLLKEMTDNRNTIQNFINSNNHAIESEKINELNTLISQLLGHYNQLLIRAEDIISKEDTNDSIKLEKEIEKRLTDIDNKPIKSKIQELSTIYDDLNNYYKKLNSLILSAIENDNKILTYNSLITKANENIMKLNNLDLSQNDIDEITAFYEKFKNSQNLSTLNKFIEKTNNILQNYTNNINDKKGTIDNRVFSLFAKINDQIIDSFFLTKKNLVYALYILEDKSKYFAIIKNEKEISILEQSFANLPNLILKKDNIISCCKITIRNAGIYYEINEYMRYIEKSYKTKMTKEIDDLIAKYKRKLMLLEENIKKQLSFIDDIALLVNNLPCDKYPNIKYNDIKLKDYFPNYKEEANSKEKEVKRLIVEVLLNPDVESEFDTLSILKTLYDEKNINSLLVDEYKTDINVPDINIDNNIRENNNKLVNNVKTNFEKINTYLNNRLEELNLLSKSPKINITITKSEDILFKDINTVLDLMMAKVICDKVYKKGQGEYAVLDYLKTGNNLKFTSKYEARALATSVDRDNFLKLLLENALKKYIYLKSSNGKDILTDYFDNLLVKEKILLQDLVNNFLNDEEILKSCIKHFDYSYLNSLSTKSLEMEELLKSNNNPLISQAKNILIELKRIDVIGNLKD